MQRFWQLHIVLQLVQKRQLINYLRYMNLVTQWTCIQSDCVILSVCNYFNKKFAKMNLN